jgi:hypothetical protein
MTLQPKGQVASLPDADSLGNGGLGKQGSHTINAFRLGDGGLGKQRSHTVNALHGRRRHELEVFLVSLEESQIKEQVFSDDDLFASIVDLATSEYGIEQKNVAAHLGVSATAVNRWKNREHAPRPYARRAVIDTVAALVKERLKSMEDC